MSTGWRMVRLGDLCTFEKVQGMHRDLPYVGLEDIESNTANFIGSMEPRSVKSATFKFSHEHVLYGRLRPYLNKVLAPDFNGHCSTEIFPIMPGPMLLREYLVYWLLTDETVSRIDATCTGARMPRADMNDVLDLTIPIPPRHEQERIVAVLDEAFDGIGTAKAHAERNLQNAREIFESLLGSVGGAPAHLGELVEITTGKLDANAAVEGGEYPFFTCAKDTYAIDKHAFDCEAILLAGNNAVGDFNVKHYKGKFNAYQRTYVITVNEKRRVLYRFLYFQLLRSLIKFKERSVGAGTKFLKLGIIRDLAIVLPSLAEQEQIASMLDAVLEETERLQSIYERKLSSLGELKSSLLYQAFSGKL